VKTRQGTKLFAIVIVTAAFAVLQAQAQAKPNLTGTWKMDVGKSDFGPAPAPTSQTDKITHDDPSLKISISQTSQMGDLNYDVTYSTDGKETTNTIRGSDFKSIAKWDGDSIVIDSKGSFNGNDVTLKDRWTLSEDGKTLNVQRHVTSPMGEADQKIVFEKQ
jgi:hypothetical protein